MPREKSLNRGESQQDWNQVTLKKNSKQLKEMNKTNGATKDGKNKVGGFKHSTTSSGMNTRSLDEHSDAGSHKKVSLSVGKLIQQQRLKLGMGQDALAKQLNVNKTVIAQYESAKAIPNNHFMNLLENKLKIHLRGKNIGKEKTR